MGFRGFSVLAFIVAVALPAAAQRIGSPAVLDLDELGVQIHRQKLLDPETGRLSIENRVVEPGAAERLVSNDEGLALVGVNTSRRRSRTGAIEPRFRAEVAERLASDPDTPLPSAVHARIDRSGWLRRPPFGALDRLSEEEADALTRRQGEELAALLGGRLAPLVNAIARRGGRSVRASSSIPMVFAELRPAEILALAAETDLVESIYDGRSVPEVDLLDFSVCAVGANTVQASVSAASKEAAILEAGNPDTCHPVLDTKGGSTTQHATQVAGVVGGTAPGFVGVAPGVNLLSAPSGGSVTPGSLEDRLEWAIDDTPDGAEAYNMSFAVDPANANGQTNAYDIVVDEFVRNRWRFIAVSAGNMGAPNPCNGGFVTTPAIAFNVLAVGRYGDQNLCPLGSGSNAPTMDSSCSVDPSSPHGDREEPDVAAPGTGIRTTNIGCGVNAGVNGTSFSAPHATGAAMLLIARKPSVEEWPELTRAILMASALDNIEGGAALSEQDGAGGIRVDRADAILASGQYVATQLTEGSFGGSSTLSLGSFTVPFDTSKLRVALAWDSAPWIAGLWGQLMVATDFDLVVRRNGSLVASSVSYDNNYEVIEVANPLSGQYTVEITAFGGILGGGAEEEYVAVAWDIFNPCLGLGFDLDNDNVCDNFDNCKQKPNPNQSDLDGDGRGDACDNCPNDFNPNQSDIDHDGMGDVCDPDKDNDGCPNNVDQHPCAAGAIAGQVVYLPGCPDNADPHFYAFEGVDTDGDGFLNCVDRDDDNDHVCDDAETVLIGPGVPLGGCVGPDPCPLHPDNSGLFCTQFRDCPEPTWWLICETSTICVELFGLIVDSVNPDPAVVRFDDVVIMNQSLYIFVPPSGDLSSLGPCFFGDCGGGGGGVQRADAGGVEGTLRLELWRKADPDAGAAERFLALVAQYQPSDVALGDLSRGALLKVDPSNLLEPIGSSLAVEAVWAPAALPGEAPPDSDGDRWPDPFDNCPFDINPDQRDSDADGFGDACDSGPDRDGDGIADARDNCVEIANRLQEDADFGRDDDASLPGVQHYGDACDVDLDNDGVVGASDFFGVFRPCLGADLAQRLDCARADLDGDGVVGASDFFGQLRPAIGKPPGPGFTRPPGP